MIEVDWNGFHAWIELHKWEFNPLSFNKEIKYRWVNENYSGHLTTKQLYELFISQKIASDIHKLLNNQS